MPSQIDRYAMIAIQFFNNTVPYATMETCCMAEQQGWAISFPLVDSVLIVFYGDFNRLWLFQKLYPSNKKRDRSRSRGLQLRCFQGLPGHFPVHFFSQLICYCLVRDMQNPGSYFVESMPCSFLDREILVLPTA